MQVATTTEIYSPETSPTKRKDSGFVIDKQSEITSDNTRPSIRILPQNNSKLKSPQSPKGHIKRKTYADDSEDEFRVTIGTKVAEGHPNYQLMYDMLTGIRIAVGRVSAKMQRNLTQDDFNAAHKLAFDA